MKKSIAVVLTALMMLSCSTVFLAAGSPVDDVKVTAADGSTVTVTTVDEATAAEATTEAKGYASNATVLDVVDIEAADGATITISVPGVKLGQNYILLHQKANGEWEKVIPTVGNGTLTATFETYSPIAIVYLPYVTPVAQAQVPTATPAAPTTDAAATLPKTGAVAVLPVAAMACLAGAVVCGRKEK